MCVLEYVLCQCVCVNMSDSRQIKFSGRKLTFFFFQVFFLKFQSSLNSHNENFFLHTHCSSELNFRKFLFQLKWHIKKKSTLLFGRSLDDAHCAHRNQHSKAFYCEQWICVCVHVCVCVYSNTIKQNRLSKRNLNKTTVEPIV